MKNAKKRKCVKVISIVMITAILLTAIGTIVFAAANDWDFQKAYNKITNANENQYPTYVVNDYTPNRPDITGEKVSLDEMELATKQWFEYVEYQYYTTETEGQYIYKIYTPVDYSTSSIMAIRDYNLDGVENTVSVGITFLDMLPIFEQITAGNVGVILSGGVASGIYGGATQAVVAGTIWATIGQNDNIIKDSKYYSTPEFMGIPSDNKWGGISNYGFYNADSLSITMQKSSQFNVQKTNTVSSTYSVGGQTNVEISAKTSFLFAEASVKTQLHGTISSALSYGVNFQQGQSVSNSETVTRTFSRRNDEEVKNVAWKLVEYVVRVPYMVEIYSAEDESLISTVNITDDLLQGVCRVFANGYIEHWNTGKLVTYSEFFEGFMTATEVVDKAKIAMGENK